jgi:signal transduction histidine kinase
MASAVLAVVVGGGFAVLIVAIGGLRDSSRRAGHSQQVLAASDGLQKLVIDLETGVRGFVITGQERFLEPWTAARAAFPAQVRALNRLVENPDQTTRVRRIGRAATDYINGYSVPLVDAARRGEASARSIATTAEGKRRVDALRAQFDGLGSSVRATLDRQREHADAVARRAVLGASIGLAGSIFLILLFGGYLTRAVALPVRRAAGMAGELAGGDLSVRMPETGTGEIGQLERAFNTMGRSLEASRDELVASRARVLAAADEARRHVVRDLHDGVQQRLVHTIVTLKMALQAQHQHDGSKEELIAEGLDNAQRANAELRELAHGLHPSVLAQGGLRAGVAELVSRTTVPVTADVSVARLAPEIEASAYFVVAEALTNVVKHSRAQSAAVKVWVDDGALRLEVRDDGVGGAHLAGSGLVGLADRLAALGGRLRVTSPPNGGTVLAASLPLSGSQP